MKRITGSAVVLIVFCCLASLRAAETKPAIYIWLEPEWFKGVQGSFRYWPGTAKPTGAWGVAGPGISAEFSQGGESEWNSMGAAAEETSAACERTLQIPRAGAYHLWVRYVDHRDKDEPFTVRLEQNGKPVVARELGTRPLVPRNDEYMLYWGFSFGWTSLDADLSEGPATLRFVIDKPGQAWRQVDAALLTDDPGYTPVAREKPPFAYEDAFALRPQDGSAWRGGGTGFGAGAASPRPKVGGRDFSMWANVGDEPKWWAAQKLDALSKFDLFFQFSAPPDINEPFHQQFAGQKNLPIMSWPGLVPGIYLGTAPNLSPETPLYKWLQKTGTPFYIQTNYANPTYDEKTGPATYAALSGPLAGQFLGFVHGEAMGTVGVAPLDKPAPTRRQHVDALAEHLRKTQAEQWSAMLKTSVPETFRGHGIACLSTESTALAHLFAWSGCHTLGYEIDATMSHAPMRIAFERGAARQFGRTWINYASGNFGDACNYFYQDPVVPRGAKAWWHSKYAVTDGVPIAWYRQLYYLNYMSGASAVFWEQGLKNQWILPGPGKHPIDLSPFGRATADFQAFVDRSGDRGEPYTPVAFLLSYGHGYEPVNNRAKMLDFYEQNEQDRELRALFDVAWHPAERLASMPISPELQSMPSGQYGNIFDILVDRPEKAAVMNDYPVVWAAGDVELGGLMAQAVQDYLNRGGTLLLNVEAARGKLSESVLGVKLSDVTKSFDHWQPQSGPVQATVPYDVRVASLAGAQALASSDDGTPLVTRHPVGKGALILTLVPHCTGRDERAHPILPWLMNGLTEKLLPVQVSMADGSPTGGQVLYQLNRTPAGWMALLINNCGIDKTQTGIARVDRRQVKDVVLTTSLRVKSARELTQPADVTPATREGQTTVSVRVHPGDIQVISLTTE